MTKKQLAANVMKHNDSVEKVAAKVKTFLEQNRTQSVAHRWDHLERVLGRAMNLAKAERNVDLEILQMAALLHDIDERYDQKPLHVKRSLVAAKRLLRRVGYPTDRIRRVLDIVSEHSTESMRLKKSIESKILFDSDKLDGLGAIGIARVFALCGQQGLTPIQAVEWYKAKIDMSLASLQTKEGRRRFRRELKYVTAFLRKFKNETELYGPHKTT